MKTIIVLSALLVISAAKPEPPTYLPPPTTTYESPVEQYEPPFTYEPRPEYPPPPPPPTHGTPPSTYRRTPSGYGSPKVKYTAPALSSTYSRKTSTLCRPPTEKPKYGERVPVCSQSTYEITPRSYQYSYQVKDDDAGKDYGHMEERDGYETTGEYWVLLPDGRTMVVTYRANKQGYQPVIQFLEPNKPNGYQ